MGSQYNVGVGRSWQQVQAHATSAKQQCSVTGRQQTPARYSDLVDLLVWVDQGASPTAPQKAQEHASRCNAHSTLSLDSRHTYTQWVRNALSCCCGRSSGTFYRSWVQAMWPYRTFISWSIDESEFIPNMLGLRGPTP